MKRGVIQLTQETNTVLREMITADFDLGLRQKIEALNPQVAYIELSQEEVEKLLDNLNQPTEASATENQLRYQLNLWLAH